MRATHFNTLCQWECHIVFVDSRRESKLRDSAPCTPATCRDGSSRFHTLIVDSLSVDPFAGILINRFISAVDRQPAASVKRFVTIGS